VTPSVFEPNYKKVKENIEKMVKSVSHFLIELKYKICPG